jgi:hypothetical protein
MLGTLELDHPAGVDIDQMIMAAMLGGLVTRTATTEIAALENATLLEQTHRAIDRGNGNAAIQRGGATIQLLHVRMILGVGQNTGDHPALAGHLEPVLDADALDARFHRLSLCPQAAA